jgi:hypothetical protein
VRDHLPRGLIACTMVLLFSWASSCPAAGAELLNDPTRPPVATAGEAPREVGKPLTWRLTSTIIGPRHQVAVINGRAVRAGETIDGAVLVGVAPGGALLQHGDRRIHLKLNTPTVKQTANAVP